MDYNLKVTFYPTCHFLNFTWSIINANLSYYLHILFSNILNEILTNALEYPDIVYYCFPNLFYMLSYPWNIEILHKTFFILTRYIMPMTPALISSSIIFPHCSYDVICIITSCFCSFLCLIAASHLLPCATWGQPRIQGILEDDWLSHSPVATTVPGCRQSASL